MDCSGVVLLMNSSSRDVVFVPVYAPLVIIPHTYVVCYRGMRNDDEDEDDLFNEVDDGE